jgi:predicted acylesterase/phospholipase RssA
MNIIKHLVIPGGSIYGFAYYGALRYLCQQNTFQIENITTMHCTSVGSIVATILSLKYEWTELDNYIINRPWQNVFKFSLYSMVSCFKDNGIFGIGVIKEIFLPLFNAKDIPIDISMKDFYNINGIELHFFTIDIETFKVVDLSYKTHPQWSLIDAIYSSSCVPILFKPLHKDNKLFVDAGILANCPIKQLFDDSSIAPLRNEVLCINIKDFRIQNNAISYTNFSLFKYIILLVSKLIANIQINSTITDYDVHDIHIEQDIIPIFDVHTVVNSPLQRTKLISYGEDCAKKYCDIQNTKK